MYNNGTIQQFIKLRSESWTYEEIAQELGVARTTLINWNNKYIRNLEHDAHEKLINFNFSAYDDLQCDRDHLNRLQIPFRQSIRFDLDELISIPLLDRIRLSFAMNKEENRLTDRQRKFLKDLPKILKNCPGPIDEEVHPPVPAAEKIEIEDTTPLTDEEFLEIRRELGLAPIGNAPRRDQVDDPANPSDQSDSASNEPTVQKESTFSPIILDSAAPNPSESPINPHNESNNSPEIVQNSSDETIAQNEPIASGTIVRNIPEIIALSSVSCTPEAENDHSSPSDQPHSSD